MLILFIANSFLVRDIFINDSGGLPLIKTYRVLIIIHYLICIHLFCTVILLQGLSTNVIYTQITNDCVLFNYI